MSFSSFLDLLTTGITIEIFFIKYKVMTYQIL